MCSQSQADFWGEFTSSYCTFWDPLCASDTKFSLSLSLCIDMRSDILICSESKRWLCIQQTQQINKVGIRAISGKHAFLKSSEHHHFLSQDDFEGSLEQKYRTHAQRLSSDSTWCARAQGSWGHRVTKSCTPVLLAQEQHRFISRRNQSHDNPLPFLLPSVTLYIIGDYYGRLPVMPSLLVNTSALSFIMHSHPSF